MSRSAHDWSVGEACKTAAGMMAEDWNALDRAKEWSSGGGKREGLGGKQLGKSRSK